MSPDVPISRRFVVALVLAFALVWFAGLDHRALLHPDEGRYAEIPREMLVTGDWLTPRLNGLKYFEKPPLQYWMTAIGYRVFGVHEWTARLWPALSTFLATLFLGYVGWRLGGARMGVYTGAAVAASAGFTIQAHLLTLDAGLTAFLSVGFGAFILAQRTADYATAQRRWMWLAWAALAGATLSKGLIGVLIPGAALVLYTIANRDLAVWRRLHLASGLGIYLVLTAPWFVAVSLANEEFFRFFFIHEHFTRYLTSEHKRGQPWWFFIPLLLLGVLPWLPVLGWGIVRTWREGAAPAGRFSWQRFALVWAAFVFVFFSASGSKLPSYILPMFPVLALVAAARLCDIPQATLLRLTWPLVAFAGLVLAGTLAFYERLITRFVPDAITLVPALAFAPWLYATMAILTTGGLITWWLLRQSSPYSRTASVLVSALTMIVAVQVGTLGYDEFRVIRSTRDMLGQVAASHGPLRPDLPFYHVHMYDQTSPFYLGRTTTFVAYRDEFALGQDAEPARSIADEAAWVALWQGLENGYAMMPAKDYARLAAAGLPMRVLHRDERRVLVSRQ